VGGGGGRTAGGVWFVDSQQPAGADLSKLTLAKRTDIPNEVNVAKGAQANGDHSWSNPETKDTYMKMYNEYHRLRSGYDTCHGCRFLPALYKTYRCVQHTPRHSPAFATLSLTRVARGRGAASSRCSTRGVARATWCASCSRRVRTRTAWRRRRCLWRRTPPTCSPTTRCVALGNENKGSSCLGEPTSAEEALARLPRDDTVRARWSVWWGECE
jgi:hypothetical protein